MGGEGGQEPGSPGLGLRSMLCGPSPLAPASGRRAPQMSRSQEGLSTPLAQALGCLHSRRRHIETWAALFVGERGRARGPPGLPRLSALSSPARPAPASPLQLELEGHWQEERRRGGEASEGQERVRAPSTGQRAPGCHTGYTICHHPQAVSQMVTRGREGVGKGSTQARKAQEVGSGCQPAPRTPGGNEGAALSGRGCGQTDRRGHL